MRVYLTQTLCPPFQPAFDDSFHPRSDGMMFPSWIDRDWFIQVFGRSYYDDLLKKGILARKAPAGLQGKV